MIVPRPSDLWASSFPGVPSQFVFFPPHKSPFFYILNAWLLVAIRNADASLSFLIGLHWISLRCTSRSSKFTLNPTQFQTWLSLRTGNWCYHPCIGQLSSACPSQFQMASKMTAMVILPRHWLTNVENYVHENPTSGSPSPLEWTIAMPWVSSPQCVPKSGVIQRCDPANLVLGHPCRWSDSNKSYSLMTCYFFPIKKWRLSRPWVIRYPFNTWCSEHAATSLCVRENNHLSLDVPFSCT